MKRKHFLRHEASESHGTHANTGCGWHKSAKVSDCAVKDLPQSSPNPQATNLSSTAQEMTNRSSQRRGGQHFLKFVRRAAYRHTLSQLGVWHVRTCRLPVTWFIVVPGNESSPRSWAPRGKRWKQLAPDIAQNFNDESKLRTENMAFFWRSESSEAIAVNFITSIKHMTT